MILMDDEYKFEDFGFICEPSNEDSISPSIERKTLAIPGRPGTWDFGVEIGEKPFSYPLRIFERHWIDREHKFNEFKNFWFDQYGQPREVKIIRDYEPDKYYMVKIASQMIPERLDDEGAFTLPLVASDPYKKLIVDSDEITWGSTVIKFNSTSITFGHSAVGLRQITSPQNIAYTVLGKAIRPTFTINGSANGLILKANDKSISLPNFNNTNWVIDGNSYSVKRNGLDTILDGIDFIEFLKGENNLIIEGSNLDFSLTVKYKDIFL